MEVVVKERADLALCEAASAAHAARLAEQAMAETEASVKANRSLAVGWAQLARMAAELALAHSTQAKALSPGSPAAREARDCAARAKGAAFSAESACRRD